MVNVWHTITMQIHLQLVNSKFINSIYILYLLQSLVGVGIPSGLFSK